MDFSTPTPEVNLFLLLFQGTLQRVVQVLPYSPRYSKVLPLATLQHVLIKPLYSNSWS